MHSSSSIFHSFVSNLLYFHKFKLYHQVLMIIEKYYFEKNLKNHFSHISFLRNEKQKQQFGFHSYYSDEMVFQSDVKNNIWGYIPSDSNLVTANYKCM